MFISHLTNKIGKFICHLVTQQSFRSFLNEALNKKGPNTDNSNTDMAVEMEGLIVKCVINI